MSVAPGWYRDPIEPATQRWWDGEGWVGEPLPADQDPPPGPPPAPAGSPTPAPPPPPPATPATGPAPPFDTRPPGATPPWPHQPVAGYGRPVPPRPYGLPLAPLGTRLVARLVDIGLVLLLNVLVNGWFAYRYWTEISPVVSEAWRRGMAGEPMGDLPEVSSQASTLLLVVVILAAALWFAYEVPAVANTGQTPGKRLLGIRVVRLPDPPTPGGPPPPGGAAAGPPPPLGFGRSIRRWNTMGLPTLLWWCFGIGLLLQLVDAAFALFDRPLQQALHDKSAFTVVVAAAAADPADPTAAPEETQP